ANGHAQATSFHIEYGPIGRPTTTTPEQSLGTTSGDTPVSGTLSGLSPSTAYQARVVVTNATDTTPGAFISVVTPASLTSQLPAVLLSPALSGLTLNPTAFAAAPHGPSALAASAGAAKKTGTLISYRDSEAATTTFTVLQSEAGVRVRG